MREEPVAITFRRIGRFFNNVVSGTLSFRLMICSNISLR